MYIEDGSNIAKWIMIMPTLERHYSKSNNKTKDEANIWKQNLFGTLIKTNDQYGKQWKNEIRNWLSSHRFLSNTEKQRKQISSLTKYTY